MADRVSSGREADQAQTPERRVDRKRIDELQRENSELRVLVVELTRIIGRNVVDRK
jgi:hypothetical protein